MRKESENSGNDKIMKWNNFVTAGRIRKMSENSGNDGNMMA